LREERDARIRLEGNVAALRGQSPDNRGSQPHTATSNSQTVEGAEDA
jgi:hypothetical protein